MQRPDAPAASRCEGYQHVADGTAETCDCGLVAVTDLPAEPIRFWLVRLHDGMLSHHSYATETARDTWAAKYRSHGDRVETEGLMIRG